MRVLLAAAVCGSLLVAAPVEAHPNYHYLGGCFLTATNAPKGGTDDHSVWTGVVGAVVVAADAAFVPSPTTAISFQCEVYKNGTYQEPVLSGSGVGTAVGADLYVFEASPDDVITLCERVIVGGDEHLYCGNASTTPVVPETLQEWLELAYDEAMALVCSMLPLLQPLPPAVEVTPEGDVYVLGYFVWDCPPYYDGGPGRIGPDWYVMTYFPV